MELDNTSVLKTSSKANHCRPKKVCGNTGTARSRTQGKEREADCNYRYKLGDKSRKDAICSKSTPKATPSEKDNSQPVEPQRSKRSVKRVTLNIPPPDPDDDDEDDTAGFENPTQRKSPSIKEFFGGSSRN